MFHLFRFAIWITGTATLVIFGLGFFGYEPNWDYRSQQAVRCKDVLSSCRNTLLHKGVDGALSGCRLDCLHPESLIRKSE